MTWAWRSWPVLAVLTADAAILALLALAMRAPESPPPGAPPAVPSSAPTATAAEPVRDYAAVVERPLFTSGRRPVSAVPSAPPRPAPVPPPSPPPPALPADLSLVGTVLAPPERVALLRQGHQPARRVREGEVFAGWTVGEIGDSGVTLSSGDSRHRLTLPKTRPAPPQSLPSGSSR